MRLVSLLGLTATSAALLLTLSSTPIQAQSMFRLSDSWQSGLRAAIWGMATVLLTVQVRNAAIAFDENCEQGGKAASEHKKKKKTSKKHLHRSAPSDSSKEQKTASTTTETKDLSAKKHRKKHRSTSTSTGTCSVVSIVALQQKQQQRRASFPLLRWISDKWNGRKMTLNVFDFDGTLFRSPMPSSDIWDRQTIGLLYAEPAQAVLAALLISADNIGATSANACGNNGDMEHAQLNTDSEQGRNKSRNIGLGWFQDPLTLSHPYVPYRSAAFKPEEWFVLEVVELVRASMADPTCATVLLTGRNELYRESIAEIVATAGLRFDAMGLKPVGSRATLPFKLAWVDDFAKRHNVSQVVVWEDRQPHADSFRSMRPDWRVHKVPEVSSLLDPVLERELVDLLRQRHQPERKFVENLPSWHIELDNPSQRALMLALEPMQEWRTSRLLDAPADRFQPGAVVQAHVVARCSAPDRICVRVAFDAVGPESINAANEAEQQFVAAAGFSTTVACAFAFTKKADRSADGFQESEWQALNKPLVVRGTVRVWHRSGLSRTRQELAHEDELQQRRRLQSAKAHGGEARVKIGTIIRRVHPHLDGRAIGDAVRRVHEWLGSCGLTDAVKNTDAIEEFILNDVLQAEDPKAQQ